MRSYFKYLFTIATTVLFVTAAPPGLAQEEPETIAFAGYDWRVDAKEARVETHLGKQALKLHNGSVIADTVVFSDGVIEFDIAYVEQTIFAGAGWRAESDQRYEDMYVRGHLNNKPDALQYTPTENGLSAWQIFSDENAIAAVSQKFDDWNHVKIVVEGDRADIYFNSDTPSLHVPDLKTDIKQGFVSLRAFSLADLPAYFTNLTIRRLDRGEHVVGEAKPSPDLPGGVINEWSISAPVSEAAVSALTLDDQITEDLTWHNLEAETNGIANIAKLSRPTREANTVFARLNITSDQAQMKEMKFGYSDRVRIYLNGKRVYAGNAGWRQRDYRFLGTVGFHDSVGLDLKQGRNELLVAVSETFGGWAWAGAIEDRAGISMSNQP